MKLFRPRVSDEQRKRVPPGQYVLRVLHTITTGGRGAPTGPALAFIGARGNAMGSRGVPSREPPLWAAEAITVGDSDVLGLTVGLRPTFRITGRVDFIGKATSTPQIPSNFLVTAQPLTLGMRTGFAGGRVNNDGTFVLTGLLPGRYVLTASPPSPWQTMKMTIGGLDVTDLPVEIDARDLVDVRFTCADVAGATLSGSLAGAARPLTEGVTALVFPEDRRYWVSPSAARRRFRHQRKRPAEVNNERKETSSGCGPPHQLEPACRAEFDEAEKRRFHRVCHEWPIAFGPLLHILENVHMQDAKHHKQRGENRCPSWQRRIRFARGLRPPDDA